MPDTPGLPTLPYGLTHNTVTHMRVFTPVLCAILFFAATASSQQLGRRSFLGARLSTPDTLLSDGVSQGARIDGIIPQTTAATAGLRPGDVVIRVGGTLVRNAQAFARLVGATPAGKTLALDVLRGGKPVRIAAEVQAFPVEAHWTAVAEYRTVGYRDARYRAICTRPLGEGPFPTVFIIQGGGCASVEEPFGGVYYELVDSLSEHGFATVRVDKNGVGDSEGPPCNSSLELAVGIFSETLAWLRNLPWVDRDAVFIYGHSAGGFIAPILATRYPVAGVVVWGTFCRPWPQVTLDAAARRLSIEGRAADEIASLLEIQKRANDLYYGQGLTRDSIAILEPALLHESIEIPPDTATMALARLNLAADWERVRTRVLVLKGEFDVESFDTDQEMIVNIVNGSRPHTATSRTVRGVDHGYRRVSSMRESLENRDAPVDLGFVTMLASWMKGVAGERVKK